MKKIFFFSVVILFFVACKHLNSHSDKTIFKLNLSATATHLDPAFSSDQPNTWSCNLLYNGLVQLDNHLQVQPCIAKRWEISEDRKTYTFHLRKDVFFHDNVCFKNAEGRKVVANDFVFSFNRLLDPATAARGNWVFENIVTAVNPFVTINDSTLQIHLLKPFAPFLQRLAIPYCSVIPHEAITFYGKDFRSNPVGTGPFKFLKWNEGEVLILHKNETYFEFDSAGNRLPYLDAVNISFISNKSTEFLKFLNHELDFVSDIDVSLKDNILTKDGKLQPRYTNEFKLLKGPYLNTEYFSILMDTSAAILKNSPLQNKKIRQAINYAFDRNEMLLFLRNNRGIAATAGFVPPSLYIESNNLNFGYYYLPERSLQLLKEAGFENGIGLSEITLHTTDQYQDFAVYIKDKLEDIGIKTKIEIVDPRMLRQMRVNMETNFFRSSWIADYPDAETYLNLFYSKSGAPPNYTRYNNLQYDMLFEKAITETDIILRNELYIQLDSIITNDAPIIPLFYDEVYRFVQNNIYGLEPDALNMLQLKNVQKKN
ncbi:MAG: ABC transporter substrate-binding protein [Fimbriimonadaceae bacterium]|nr:ABC transporter substrate-binding protein [Chitinophagales bacterium]